MCLLTTLSVSRASTTVELNVKVDPSRRMLTGNVTLRIKNTSAGNLANFLWLFPGTIDRTSTGVSEIEEEWMFQYKSWAWLPMTRVES